MMAWMIPWLRVAGNRSLVRPALNVHACCGIITNIFTDHGACALHDGVDDPTAESSKDGILGKISFEYTCISTM